jgi:hypothetical protein
MVCVRAASRVGTMSEPRPTARREWLLTVEDRWFLRALRIRPDLRNEEPTPTDAPERDQEGGRNDCHVHGLTDLDDAAVCYWRDEQTVALQRPNRPAWARDVPAATTRIQNWPPRVAPHQASR